MKSLLASLTALILAIASLPSQASPQVQKIQSMLAKPEVLCGQFEQKKMLSGLKSPLTSSGRFCVLADKGVLWRTLKPFPSTVKLTRNEITQMQGDRVTMRLDSRQEPAVRMINSVLFSLISGDLTQLDNVFQVDARVHGNKWNVALKAREPAVAKAIGQISLDGGSYVRNIVINEASGDRTSIVFSGIQTGVSAMTADEAALL